MNKKQKKIKKGTVRIEIKSRKGDDYELSLIGIVPIELAGDIIRLVMERKE